MFGIELLAVMVFGAGLDSVSAPLFAMNEQKLSVVVDSRTPTGYAAGIRLTPEPLYGTVANSVTPCPTEDSVNCLWDGRHNGGATFVDVNGTPIYLTGRIND